MDKFADGQNWLGKHTFWSIARHGIKIKKSANSTPPPLKVEKKILWRGGGDDLRTYVKFLRILQIFLEYNIYTPVCTPLVW